MWDRDAAGTESAVRSAAFHRELAAEKRRLAAHERETAARVGADEQAHREAAYLHEVAAKDHERVAELIDQRTAERGRATRSAWATG